MLTITVDGYSTTPERKLFDKKPLGAKEGKKSFVHNSPVQLQEVMEETLPNVLQLGCNTAKEK